MNSPEKMTDAAAQRRRAAIIATLSFRHLEVTP